MKSEFVTGSEPEVETGLTLRLTLFGHDEAKTSSEPNDFETGSELELETLSKLKIKPGFEAETETGSGPEVETGSGLQNETRVLKRSDDFLTF